MTTVHSGDILHIPWNAHQPLDCDAYLVVNDKILVRISMGSYTSALEVEPLVKFVELWVDVHFERECATLERHDESRALVWQP